MAIGYDPYTKLSKVPNNPKARYKVMTKEMPKGGNLSLNMMYQTAGTQINLDYISENDFIKKFKLIASNFSKKLHISSSTFATFYLPYILFCMKNNSLELEFDEAYTELIEKEIELI